MTSDETVTQETVELLQHLIRNRCVNDGTPESGEETRNVELLRSFLGGQELALETFEPTKGRGSLVARIEGSDPRAPSVCLMGHLDVVPVTPATWREDPFGGELIDGEVWGRGAVDMFNLTSSMAVAFRALQRSGFRPRGNLIFFGVADEEAGGTHGARWFADHRYEAIAADYVLTEFGGLPVSGGGKTALTIACAEKGLSWRRLRVKGSPGHGSMPFGTDNALVKAAEVVRRLADYRPRAQIHDLWRLQVESLGLPDEVREQLLDPERVLSVISMLNPSAKRFLHACTHTTFSPNVCHGGGKVNVIPDEVHIDLDVRTLPGETADDVQRHLEAALGDLAADVGIDVIMEDLSSRSPVDTPMWHALQEAMRHDYPEATLLPSLMVGCTDARFYRHKGAVAYGAGLFSRKVDMSEFGLRFHGNDERIDIESLGLSTRLWIEVCKRMLA